eukprot:CAMPEP_0181203714 /NCGR_PEP_ID=MMETSP1096-20121128/19542_1 /TAXON_ID=156174 ORGANISM="Chrysochromulina ericina, Strain CCMP281" /NCGR_SAMPLE_ID=MMETSP1096 /ASSEMBLY_ACC=CAM_ASM_000453 /LENGTH=47 /DNA_ID= /DNA_START= /DNA_END= /DNA_ORIENTATION=
MTPRSRCANMGANGGVYWKNEELVERASSEKLTRDGCERVPGCSILW